jgi:hypothetical protein
MLRIDHPCEAATMRTCLAFILLLASMPVQAQNQPVPAKNPAHSQPGQQPAQSPPAVPQQSNPPAQDDQSTHSIRIVSLPPKDLYDFVAIGISGILASVGIWGIWVATRTLNALRDQTHELARQNTNMVAAERGRIAITFPDEQDVMRLRFDIVNMTGTFHVNLKNIGRTAVYDIETRYDTCAVEMYDTHGSESAVPALPATFWVASPAQIEGNSWERTEGPLLVILHSPNKERPEMFYSYLRISVAYRDIFHDRVNTTKMFVRRKFYWFVDNPEEAKAQGWWEATGEPADNQAT